MKHKCICFVRNYRLVNCNRRLISSAPKDLAVFPDKYDASHVEEGWYQWWESQDLFKSSGSKRRKETFSMILPPPNVTGHLHLGHALTVAIEDTLVRWHRMRGFDTVWIPGSDHAGIATQSVVEKWLYATTKEKRVDIGRETFLEKVWEWKEGKGNHIFSQLRRMGASLDWEKSTFTMSEEHTAAVNEAFRLCLEKGLIYRTNRLVHWSPAIGSVLSDIEVDHLQIEAGKKMLHVPSGTARVGQMYDIAYQVVNSDQVVTVSTTRPETILGDVAVAVHPSDPRYTSLLNEKVLLKHPLREDLIPLIADADGVDPELGTGAVKITPNHDFNDFKIAQRLSLPSSIIIMDGKGNMTFPDETESPFQLTPDGKTFLGLPRFQARHKVLNYLESKSLLVQVRDHPMSVPICSRSGDIVEPLPKPQWFLSMQEAAQAAFHYGQADEIAFQPPSYKNVWNEWFKRTEDWCLSRQLWWGHQIPMFRVQGTYEEPDIDQGGVVLKDNLGQFWVFGTNEEEALANARTVLKTEEIRVTRDEDVLDTWFSSSLLPFSNFKWPTSSDSADFKKHFPLSLMETGHDILFFWVARMVMISHILFKELPFKKVMLHSMICDGYGRKMSKSVGNVVDPLHIINGVSLKHLESELMESKAKGSLSAQEYGKALSTLRKDFPQGIAACGSDALRYGLCHNDVSSGQIRLDLKIIKTSAVFCNKIWQLVRYLHLAKRRSRCQSTPLENIKMPTASSSRLENLWILSQCGHTVNQVNCALEARSFHLVTRALREFMYHSLCDIYVEASKTVLNDPSHPEFEETLSTLYVAVTTGLKLMHPLMPFITEELYQRIQVEFKGGHIAPSIMQETFPEYHNEWSQWINSRADLDVEFCMAVVGSVRSVKNLYGMKRKHLTQVVIVSDSEEVFDSLQRSRCLIESLAPSGTVEVRKAGGDDDAVDLKKWSVEKCPSLKFSVFVDIASHINVELELQRNLKKLQKLNNDHAKLLGKKKLPNPAITEKLSSLSETIRSLEEQIQFLKSL